MSWKVRRASAKLLSAVISTRSELVTELFSRVAPVVISRFKEREESVRVDVLHAFVALVRQVKENDDVLNRFFFFLVFCVCVCVLSGRNIFVKYSF